MPQGLRRVWRLGVAATLAACQPRPAPCGPAATCDARWRGALSAFSQGFVALQASGFGADDGDDPTAAVVQVGPARARLRFVATRVDAAEVERVFLRVTMSPARPGPSEATRLTVRPLGFGGPSGDGVSVLVAAGLRQTVRFDVTGLYAASARGVYAPGFSLEADRGTVHLAGVAAGAALSPRLELVHR